MFAAEVLALLLAMATVGLASKDNDYYYPGFVNPNTDSAMYWKDAMNVLQDLDQFEALYVSYHNCVWSKYGSVYGTGDDYDEQGQDYYDVGSKTHGCGGYGGEFYWYMGRTQCFRANAAFSLYGVLRDSDDSSDSSSSSSSSACGEATYINSFFTTHGVEVFSAPLGLSTSYANSYCTASAPSDDATMYVYGDADDDYLDDNVQLVNYAAYTSSGTGCMAGKFVTDEYQGAFCNGHDYIQTTNTLSIFNSNMEAQECVQIYDYSWQGRGLEEDSSIDFSQIDKIDILKYSRSCSILQYPAACPDPFGKLQEYRENIAQALAQEVNYETSDTKEFLDSSAWVFMVGGVLLIAGSLLLVSFEKQAAGGGREYKRDQALLSERDPEMSDRTSTPKTPSFSSADQDLVGPTSQMETQQSHGNYVQATEESTPVPPKPTSAPSIPTPAPKVTAASNPTAAPIMTPTPAVAVKQAPKRRGLGGLFSKGKGHFA